jgi:hypothetical protein
VGSSLRDNCLAVLAVDVGTLDGAVVKIRDAHVGPVDMTGLGIDDDAVGQMAIRYNRLTVRAVRIHRVNTAGVQLEDKKTRSGCASVVLLGGFRHVAPVWRADAKLVSA